MFLSNDFHFVMGTMSGNTEASHLFLHSCTILLWESSNWSSQLSSSRPMTWSRLVSNRLLDRLAHPSSMSRGKIVTNSPSEVLRRDRGLEFMMEATMHRTEPNWWKFRSAPFWSSVARVWRADLITPSASPFLQLHALAPLSPTRGNCCANFSSRGCHWRR